MLNSSHHMFAGQRARALEAVTGPVLQAAVMDGFQEHIIKQQPFSIELQRRSGCSAEPMQLVFKCAHASRSAVPLPPWTLCCSDTACTRRHP